uniref:hypothetical protein n=1 Tax=Streptomyces tubercidicus TaxID=47759 RepID=UPI0037DC4BD3|nr:site-specific integrase [Streptomyces tubercidicus]
MTEQDAPGVRRLERLVEKVAPRDPARWEARPPLKRGRLVSRSRADQLRATVRQLGLAVRHEEMPEGCGQSVEALLSPHSIDAFLELASGGTFRDPDKPALLGKALSWSSLATLRDCLVILGEEADVEVVVPSVWRQPAGQVPSEKQAAAVYRRVAGMAAGAPLDPLLARTVAVVGMILDTGMQTGALLSRQLSDVDLEAGTVRAVYRTQNATHRPAVEAVLPLREGAVVAVQRWLGFRRALIDALEGADHGALWVTVQASTKPGADGDPVTYEAGMPLGPNGFRAAHASAMEQLNAVLAGRWDQSSQGPWLPLPLTPEGLRRAVDVEALVPALAEVRGRFDEPDQQPRWADGPHAGVPSFAVHGRESTYVNYRCRCKACYLEMSARNAARRAARG